MKAELPEEIQDKLEKIFTLKLELEKTKDEIETYFNKVLKYDLYDLENNDLDIALEPIFDGDVGGFGDGIDEAIGKVIEAFSFCEPKEENKWL